MKIPPSTLTDVRNEIVRVKSNLEAIKDGLFTDGDRAILEPRYREILKKLQEKEKLLTTEVKDHETVQA